MVEKAGYAEYKPALVDVYSFGILVWTVASRQKPYGAVVRAKRMNLWKLREFISVQGGRPKLHTEEDEYAPPAMGPLLSELTFGILCISGNAYHF